MLHYCLAAVFHMLFRRRMAGRAEYRPSKRVNKWKERCLLIDSSKTVAIILQSSTVCAFLVVQEQTCMAKLGLELRLLSSDVDTEVEKWEEQEHDIVRQSQSLASMAYNMYLFTR